MQATDGFRPVGVERPMAEAAGRSEFASERAVQLPFPVPSGLTDRFGQNLIRGVPMGRARPEVELIPPKLREKTPLFDSNTLARLQREHTVKVSGRTLEELTALNVAWLHGQARAGGKSVGEYIRGETTRRGYGGSEVKWWPSLSTAQQTAWNRRFERVVQRIKDRAPADVSRLITRAERRGGGVLFDPSGTEELNVIAYRLGNILGVGKSWVEAAEQNPERVYANIVHELGGHLEYGGTLTGEMMQASLDSLLPEERLIALTGPRDIYTAYDYTETELYAELREYAYRIPESSGDHPFNDVRLQLGSLKHAFHPVVAEALVRGFRYRVQRDAAIDAGARRLLDNAIVEVFGIRFVPFLAPAVG